MAYTSYMNAIMKVPIPNKKIMGPDNNNKKNPKHSNWFFGFPTIRREPRNPRTNHITMNVVTTNSMIFLLIGLGGWI